MCCVTFPINNFQRKIEKCSRSMHIYTYYNDFGSRTPRLTESRYISIFQTAVTKWLCRFACLTYRWKWNYLTAKVVAKYFCKNCTVFKVKVCPKAAIWPFVPANSSTKVCFFKLLLIIIKYRLHYHYASVAEGPCECVLLL